MAMRPCDGSEPILRSYRPQSLRSAPMHRVKSNGRHGRPAVTTFCLSLTAHTNYSREFPNTCNSAGVFAAVHESAFGTKRTCQSRSAMSAFEGKADMTRAGFYVGDCR